MERQPSSRPSTNRPPTGMAVPRSAMPSRPITQQGLSGLRPPPTSGQGTNRMYRDKRYYTSKIQAHMNAIRDEINRLNKSTLDCRVASINRQEMRRTAETTAKSLTEKQELLTIYNTALDMHLSKTRTEEIVAETAELKQRNDLLLKELDNVFQKKLKKEEQIGELKIRIQDEEAFIKGLIEKLSPESREKYYALAEENKKVLENISNMQSKIKESKETIEKYKASIAQSSGKQKKLQLLRNLTRLTTQKDELETFVQNTLTPAQQREKLLDQVKQDKSDIESLMKVKDSVEEELGNNESRLADLEHELDGKDNARLKKHKELRERGEHMEKFIAEYGDKSEEIKTKIKDVNVEISSALEYLSENLTEINLKELDVKFDSGEQNTVEGWNNKFKLLTGQINRIAALKQKYEGEISEMKEKMGKMREELDLYSDVETGKEKMEDKKMVLLESQLQLQGTLESTRSAVVEAKKKREDLKSRIEGNEEYTEIMKLENQIEESTKENEELENIIKSESNSEEMDQVFSQLDELLAERNSKLIDSLKKNKF
ncbi:PREDICTED: intraflagellar transport protein 74 homolog [Nicrophorus vespilloides]|uniref:Intraflagellar transport protein 74 homolog n=1 Tax=Nicrophorus vespilloides TaxID=110193 RepID=A0ABM1NG77_NICVS|nr:PREDICTED: intraflagellar transport protein 74 homolog [Nicrophorus vespilloides]